MNVSDILLLMANQSIGLDAPTDSDLPVYLRYLNLAYLEILRKTIINNPTIPKLRETVTSDINGTFLPSKPIFSIRSISTVNPVRLLTATNLDTVLTYDPLQTQTNTSPSQWFYDSGVINLFPKYQGMLSILYVPIPASLTANSLSADIGIPEIFHQILVDGACYYIFQSETGFKDQAKMMETKERWIKGLSELGIYLRNLGGQINYSTYSVV